MAARPSSPALPLGIVVQPTHRGAWPAPAVSRRLRCCERSLYLPVLRLLEAKLRRGAIVIADNIETFEEDVMPYVEYVRPENSAFISCSLNISNGMELSVFEPAGT
jgi:hypothetical protein